MKKISSSFLQRNTEEILNEAHRNVSGVQLVQDADGFPMAIMIGYPAWCELQASLPLDHPFTESTEEALDLARQNIEAVCRYFKKRGAP